MSLIPYLLVAAYAFKLTQRGETYELRPEERTRDLAIAVVATLYTAFMLWAGGIRYILLACILFGPGTALYYWARREQDKTLFTAVEWVVFLLVVLGFVVGIYSLATGAIQI
jgi:arginine:ornithine antiporter/lysine permease